MVPAKIHGLRMMTWPSSLTSLVVLAIACNSSQRVKSPGGALSAHPMGSATRVAAIAPSGNAAGAEPSPSANDEPGPLDAESKLLQFLRAGQTLYIKQALPDGIRCVTVEPRPSVSNGSAGLVILGTKKSEYTVDQGRWNISPARESWALHGASSQSVLVSGALLTTTKEACEADTTRRPLALVRERCAALPLPLRRANEASDTQWIFTRQTFCGAAGAYFSQGKRYPFEFFAPLGVAWLTGPLAGSSGEPRLVPMRFDSGRLELGETVIDAMPFLYVPPKDAEPTTVEAGAHDFARDFMAESRTFYIPLLREGNVSCAAADLSHLHGNVILPRYSGSKLELEYIKHEFGVEIWLANQHERLPEGRGSLVRGCGMIHSHLSVHGRDHDSYHVDGSRWFFDRNECERQRGQVLPSLIWDLNLKNDACAEPDKALLAREAVAWKGGAYYVPDGQRRSCLSIEVSVDATSRYFLSGQIAKHLALPQAAVVNYRYNILAKGRYIWLTPFNSADATIGQFHELRSNADGVQVGDEPWFTDKLKCTQSLSTSAPDAGTAE